MGGDVIAASGRRSSSTTVTMLWTGRAPEDADACVAGVVSIAPPSMSCAGRVDARANEWVRTGRAEWQSRALPSNGFVGGQGRWALKIFYPTATSGASGGSWREGLSATLISYRR